jgi:hypothetical protein
VAKRMQSNPASFMANPESVKHRVQDRRDHLVPGIRAASTVYEEKFMGMSLEMR